MRHGLEIPHVFPAGLLMTSEVLKILAQTLIIVFMVKDNLWFKNIYFWFVCVRMLYSCVCLFSACVPCLGCQKRASDSLKLALDVVKPP